MMPIPFFKQLEPARRVLVAGAGGGFDVFCGLPLFFALREAGKEVFLANLAFTSLDSTGATRLGPALWHVTADSSPPGFINYFPEGYLSQWFRAQGEEVPVFAFPRTGAVPLRRAYETLVALLGVDTLILVDGGTDALMRGDEEGLGTPHEDITSIAATYDLPLPRKLLACLGFGIDHFHGVCHTHFLEGVAELARAGAYLGAFSLTAEMECARRFRAASESVFEQMPHHVSIVNSSILSAIEGRFGDHHATDRTRGSELFINPLMALYWCFHLVPVAGRVRYLERMAATETWDDVRAELVRWEGSRTGVRPAVPLPL
ncbi:MAG: DUF1152 domain-containing protein [Gemmataceae bacterium]|nr:DUF1152 domain-containing protein [Gemmataceae bacterium]